jgi:ketosteroid isomerase-like protein
VSAGDESLEVVRRGLQALKDADIDGLVSLTSEDFVMTTPSDLASEPDTYRGAEGVRRYFDSFYEVMDQIYIEALEVQPFGPRVYAETILHARGRSTGIETEQHAHLVWTVREGKATKLEAFVSREDALAAIRA